MRKMGIGLQMYTLRHEAAADFEGTLRRVAELGYEGVEFAGYGGMEAAELKTLLDELGLQAIGGHVSLERMRTHLQEEIDILLTLGARYLVCPYVAEEERPDPEAWRRLFTFFARAGEEVRKQGLVFAYHNHDFELQTKVDDTYVLDALFAASPAGAVKAELDVCWIQYAGQDPVAYIRRYAGRLPLLHLKDFTREADGRMKTLELGRGDVLLHEVLAASSEAGVVWLVVEQDYCSGPALNSVSESLTWVKENYLRLLS